MSAKCELRSVSTDRRSLPKAVDRVVPQCPMRGERKSCSGCFQSQNARVRNGDAPHITATTCFSGIWRGWGFCVLSCAAKAAFVSRRGEGARMGGGDAPPSARLLVLRSASREGGSLKPGGGKSSPDRQRRSFVAPGFVVARSAEPSTKNFEEPKNRPRRRICDILLLSSMVAPAECLGDTQLKTRKAVT